MSTTTTSTSRATHYDLNLPPNPLDEFSAEERRAHEQTLNTPNRTAVGPFRRGGIREYPWNKLDSQNRDTWWKYRDDVSVWESADAQYKIGMVSAFGLQLGMNDLLIQKAIIRLMEIDVPRLGLNLEEVAFCVCGVVVNENAKERYRDEGEKPFRDEKEPLYNPYRKDENNPEEYVQLANRIIERFERASMKRIRSCWQKLSQSGVPERKAQHWRPAVKNDPFVPLHPPAVRQHFTDEELRA